MMVIVWRLMIVIMVMATAMTTSSSTAWKLLRGSDVGTEVPAA